MVSRPLQQILEQDSEFDALTDQLKRYRLLQTLWQKVIPAEWREGTDALILEEGTLTVGVFHPALSMRLRQMEPSLVKALRSWLPGLEQIRFKVVLPPASPARPEHAPTETLTAETVKAFADLAAEIEPSPLKDALQRLVKARQG